MKRLILLLNTKRLFLIVSSNAAGDSALFEWILKHRLSIYGLINGILFCLFLIYI